MLYERPWKYLDFNRLPVKIGFASGNEDKWVLVKRKNNDSKVINKTKIRSVLLFMKKKKKKSIPKLTASVFKQRSKHGKG